MTTPTVQTTSKRQRRKVSDPIDWASYDKALVRRGNITLWFSEEAVQAWYSPLGGKLGGQRKYSGVSLYLMGKSAKISKNSDGNLRY